MQMPVENKFGTGFPENSAQFLGIEQALAQRPDECKQAGDRQQEGGQQQGGGVHVLFLSSRGSGTGPGKNVATMLGRMDQIVNHQLFAQ